MTIQVTFASAAAYTLDELSDIFTRSFEDYFYPGTTTAAILAARVRAEQIDLQRSLVMRVAADPVGIALLGLRGDRAWCGGFGVMLPLRGRGLAHELAAAMLEQARQAGARGCVLEVLIRNQRAIKAYTRVGFQPLRDLQVLEWGRPHPPAQDSIGAEIPRAEQRADAGDQQAVLVSRSPAALLAHFAALHPTPAAWQRDLPALLVRSGMVGAALIDSDQLRAYVLLTPLPNGGARIEDLGATDAAQAAMLLAALQARYTRLISVNEPADSTLTSAFAAAGFTEADRQHELWVDL
jgi:RimJ/RimL family protein N-acetyltransferase